MVNSSGYGQRGGPAPGQGQRAAYQPPRGPAPQPRQSRTGYVYQERPAEALKERAERTGGRFDSIYKSGFDTWKPKQGINVIRFLPPTWDNAEHFSLLINVHSYIGPDQGSYLCLYKHFGKPCPICHAADEARRAGETDEAKQNTVSERALSWIVDRYGDDPTKPQIYQMSWTQDRDIAALCRDPRTGAPLWIDHPDIGFDLSFQRLGTTKTNTKYMGYQVMRDASPIAADLRVQDQIMQYIVDNPLPSVLQFYPAEYLEKALLGTTHAAADDGAGAGLLHPAQQQDWGAAQDPYEPDVQHSNEPFDASVDGSVGYEEPGQTEEPPWEPEPEQQPLEQQRPQFSQRMPDEQQPQRAPMQQRPQQTQQRAAMPPQQHGGAAPGRATMRPPATRLPPPR